MTRRPPAALALLAGVLLLSGHVGSPNVIVDGDAGPYAVRVVVRPPEVIPGRAQIDVRVAGEGVSAVTVRPVRWDLGVEGAPRPDPALPVAGEPGLWSSELWLMEFGSYSVHVGVEGARGPGTLVVPVPSVARRIAEMPRGTGAVLVGLGLFLLVGLLTLVGAAVREAELPPGETPAPARVRRSWVARAVAVPVLALLLLVGSRWWGAEDAFYARNLYRPPEVTSGVAAGAEGRELTIRVTDWRAQGGAGRTPLLPDHGKLMHLFLVRQPGLDAFAHLHPERVDSATFRVALPPLPAGEYRLYGDILHESGFPQTLVDTVRVPTGPASEATDPDDSWLLGAPTAEAATRLEDNSTMRWERPARQDAGEPLTLRFRVTDPTGAPARPEPYMGMMAHAAVTRDDGSVFVHLHPGGTVSTTARARFDPSAGGHVLRADATGLVEFPYEFPEPGRYRIWVQVKHDGKILTGAYRVEVE